MSQHQEICTATDAENSTTGMKTAKSKTKVRTLKGWNDESLNTNATLGFLGSVRR
jgi:hypothetical protein